MPDIQIFAYFLIYCIRSPSTSRIRAKMLYSTSKDRIKQELDGFHYEIQATDPTEVDLEVLRERAH
jgi:cofilin